MNTSVEEIDRRIVGEIGKRNHIRQIYAEFMAVSYANITATDLALEIGKSDIVSWNIADDIRRRMNKIESTYREHMDDALKVQYCNLMNEYEQAISKQLEALRRKASNETIFSFLMFMAMVDAINDNVVASKGTIAHKSIRDIRNGIDSRWRDILKRGKLLDKAKTCYLSAEYKDLRRVLQSNWHLERVYHKKIKN